MLGVNRIPEISERRMHIIRWILTVGWLVMILSLFWDPVSIHLTDPENAFSPWHFDPNQCVPVQGACLAQQPHPIALSLFWTIVVPSSILILLVLGHETWRRICPLSFLSQLPRALGIQRKRQGQKSGAGATRYELVKIKKDSWLGKNHLYVQFGLLTLGLIARLLWMNADCIALAVFLILTILAAIAVGYLYEGKSWCQYFCPMAPVQMVFTGPRGLLGREAHQGQRQSVTQSMCRTIDKDGNEKSACVGCQSPCIDIDAERTYWETFSKPGRRFVQYGYVGLLLGFFLYYFLYAGNFDYLFSGAWLREENLLGTVGKPGFYILDQAIPIPKWVAVPLTLNLAIVLSYWGLSWLEKIYRHSFKQLQKPISQQQASHIVFSVCTFLSFNLFFFFSSRSVLAAFPFPVHLLLNGLIVLVSTLWLSRTLDRTAELYTRESLASSLRRQLGKLTVDFSRFLEGRSMEDLKAEEVYVLAKVLPGFNQEHSLQVYKGVLREALEQGNTDSASSLEALRQIRQELNIKDEDHFTVLTELGLAEPELLDSKKRRTRESQLRIESYQQALASMLLDLVDSGMSLQEAMQRQKKQIQFLKLEYGMTSEEEEKVLSQLLAGEQSTILRKAETLLEQMQQLALRYQVLGQQGLDAQTAVFKFLRLTAVQHKQQIITKQMLSLLELLGNTQDAIGLANSTRTLAANVLPEILQTPDGSLTWKARLQPEVLAVLEPIQPASDRPPAELRQFSNSALLTTADIPSLHPTPATILPGMLQTPERAMPRQPGLRSDLPAMPKVTQPEMTDETGELGQFSNLDPSTNQDAPVEVMNLAMPRSGAVRSPESKSLEDVLNELVHELDPLIQALALYGLNRLTPQKAQEKARQILKFGNPGHWLVRETAQGLIEQDKQTTQEVQTLMVQILCLGKVDKRLFQQPVVRVGSHPANDIVLADPSVAAHHAVFYLDGEGFSILDLGSPSGLHLGNKHLQNERDRLIQGQMIRLSAAKEPALTVFWEAQPLRTQVPSAVMGTLDKVLLLFESRFFRSLKPDALVELGRDAAVKVYPQGERLCEAGDPSDSILLLINGTADVVVLRGDTQQVVGTVNVGETIGEMGVLTRQKRSASVVAASEYCRALVIQADKFDAILRQDPEVARNLLVVLSMRLQTMTSKVKSVARA